MLAVRSNQQWYGQSASLIGLGRGRAIKRGRPQSPPGCLCVSPSLWYPCGCTQILRTARCYSLVKSTSSDDIFQPSIELLAFGMDLFYVMFMFLRILPFAFTFFTFFPPSTQTRWSAMRAAGGGQASRRPTGWRWRSALVLSLTPSSPLLSLPLVLVRPAEGVLQSSELRDGVASF